MSGVGEKIKTSKGGGAPPLASALKGPRRTPPNGGDPRNALGELGGPIASDEDLVHSIPPQSGSKFPIVSISETLKSAEIFTDGDWVESKDQDPNGDIRLVQLADIGDGCFLDKSSRFMTKEKAIKLRCTFLKPGDILLARMPDPLGRACIFPGDPKPSVTVVDICIIRPDLSKHEPRWLMHCFNGPECRNHIAELATGTTRTRISRGNLGDIRIPLPPLPEQRRIAEVLDGAAGLKTAKKKVLLDLNSLTDALFHEMFDTKGLQEQSIGELLYSGALLLHKDGNHGSQYPRSEDFGVDGIPFLSAKSISDDGFIDNTQIEKLSEAKALSLRIGWIEKGDVLLSHNASVGRVALYDGRFERALIGTSLTSFRPNPAKLDSHYLAAVLCTQYFQTQLKKNMGQATRNQVPITAQRELRIVTPTIKLQQEFARRIAAVEKLKAAHRASLAQIDALFASLQHRAFRGEL